MSRDLKEAIENFKSVARPFQTMFEVVDQIDAAATDIRSIKDLEARKAVLVKEQEDAVEEAKDVRAKAKAYADQKVADAESKAEQIVVEARKTAESVLESAQRKASAVDNAALARDEASNQAATQAAEDLEFAKAELAKVDALAEATEKRLTKAQASISKLLEG